MPTEQLQPHLPKAMHQDENAQLVMSYMNVRFLDSRIRTLTDQIEQLNLRRHNQAKTFFALLEKYYGEYPDERPQ